MPLALYPPIVTEADLSPDHYGSEIDDIVEDIVSATAGWGANKQKTIDALATIDATTRTKVAARWKELHGEDSRKIKTLKDLMKSEFSGNFGIAMELLALPPHQAECNMIRKGCKGIGANATVIWSILVGRTNAEMELLKKTFYDMYDKDLGKLLASELHGDMERIIFNCLQAGEETFDEQFHTAEKALEDAELIHSKGQGKTFGTDEKGIFKVLCAAPKEHLENVNRAYADKYGYTLEKALEKELGGLMEKNVRDATLHLIGMKLKPFESIAHLFHLSTKGLGTDELLLTCNCIRYQTVLPQLMSSHIEVYGKTIHDRVRSEVSGKYKEVLLQILNTAWPEEAG